jgi:predicted deacylase
MRTATTMSPLSFDLPKPDLGAWRAGNTGTEGVWAFSAHAPGPTVMVTALVHGNELCGAWALLQALQAGLRPRRGSLVLAFCNLQAFDAFDERDPDASRFLDEDMNRVWGEGLRDRAPSREQRRAVSLLPFVERADWLLDLHSMHEPGVPLLLTGLQPRNVELARQLGTPAHVVIDAGHKDGVRLRDHGALGSAAATGNRALLLECGYHGELASRDVALDMLGRFLAASGAVPLQDIPAEWLRPLPERGQQVLEVTGGIVAPSLDLRFAEPWLSGQAIARAGTVLGWSDGQPFVTPHDDCTLVMPSLRQLRPGVTVMRLAKAKAF